MAMTPRQAATLFFGTSLFGLLTFSSGLMIGVGIGSGTTLPALPNAGGVPLAAAKPPAAPAAAPTPAAAMTASTQGAGAGSVLLPMPQQQKPAVGVPGTSSATSAAAAAPQSAPGAAAAAVAVASAAAATPAAAVQPMAVKDFRVGLPLDVASASPLRGRLVAATLAAPRDLTIAPPAAAAQSPAGAVAAAPVQAGAAAAMPAAAAAPASPSPAPPFVFSVQVGSFLVMENAERLAAELTRHGYAAQVLIAQSAGEPTWYPVVLAPAGDVATVARQAQEFTASEGRNTEVVSWLAAK